MTNGHAHTEFMPAVADPAAFDREEGSWLERLVFNHRAPFVLLCVVLTVVLGASALKLQVNAAFDNVIPRNHPYIKNYFELRDKLGGLGNSLRIVVEAPGETIYDPKFLETTRRIHDDLFLTPGVDRAWMRSIWTPAVRWVEVTEEGFRGGPVMPENYDGTAETMAQLQRNIRTAGLVGQLVASDQKSVMFVLPLLEKYQDTGRPLDYTELAKTLETRIRDRYAHAVDDRTVPVKVHIVGFAKLVGDLIDGLHEVAGYFALAALVVAAILFLYTRCIRSTVLVIACSLVAVVWQLGLIAALGYDLNPYSLLVPFLVFAIGVSHAAQKMNGIMQDVGRGTHPYVAARYTFRRLFLAGLTALIADAVGFAVLAIIDIPVIKDLAVTASIGVAVLVFTNLLLLPVALSYVGVGKAAALRSLSAETSTGPTRGLAGLLVRLTERRWARITLVASALAMVAGSFVAANLQVGDLDAGAPELRPDSRYNRDVAFINANYRLSGDEFVVFSRTPPDGCALYRTVKELDQLGWELAQLPGVRHTVSLADKVAATVSGLQEGNPKWLSITRSEKMVGGTVYWNLTDNPDLADAGCSVIPLVVYLTDHKAKTLDAVVATVEKFAADHNAPERTYLLAAGSAGIEAVTNVVVRNAIVEMYLAVYGAVALLCFITFRSWRAVVVALIPLIMTSVLCKALMVVLGIGLKVATLPVIALGVGIGVDYALYLLSVQLAFQRAGMSLHEAYGRAIAFTGKVVALVGVTLAAGVITWAWSPIKFQADMGVLLAFMFLWNMVGALVLIPALSHFLLPRAGKPASSARGLLHAA